MSLTFRGTPIYGTHGQLIQSPPALQTVRTKFMGVNGESQIVGGNGRVEIVCRSWIHDASFTTDALLIAYLTALKQQVGAHGVLEQDIPAWNLAECCFEGFTPDELGPLPDLAGGLGPGNRWWCMGVLRWTELTVWA